jgi:hypothetical protein
MLLRKPHKNLLGQDPGKYQIVEGISPEGDYFLSRFQGSKCMKMPSARRFNYEFE